MYAPMRTYVRARALGATKRLQQIHCEGEVTLLRLAGARAARASTHRGKRARARSPSLKSSLSLFIYTPSGQDLRVRWRRRPARRHQHGDTDYHCTHCVTIARGRGPLDWRGNRARALPLPPSLPWAEVWSNCSREWLPCMSHASQRW